ncbi:MAG: hypothetical protein K9M56_09180 [Victivallales bacterium]|nr:hypothetical protein [Victivallales bacterium]
MYNEFKNWNEYTWERELKKQDRFIANYIEELDINIDLPHESEQILKRLEKKNIINSDSLKNNFFSEEKDMDEVIFNESLENNDNIKLFSRLSSLSSEFSLLLSGYEDEKTVAAGLYILSLYGKLVSNALDFIDLEDNTIPALKIALSKRMIAVINIIIGNLSDIENKLVENEQAKIERQIRELLLIRQLMIDFRYKYKTAK